MNVMFLLNINDMHQYLFLKQLLIHISTTYILYIRILCVQGFRKKYIKKKHIIYHDQFLIHHHFLYHDHLLYLYKWLKNNSKLFFKYIKYNIKNTYIRLYSIAPPRHPPQMSPNAGLSSSPIYFIIICVLEWIENEET